MGTVTASQLPAQNEISRAVAVARLRQAAFGRIPDEFAARVKGWLAETNAKSTEETVQMATSDTVIGIIQAALVMIGSEKGVLSEDEKLLLRAPLRMNFQAIPKTESQKTPLSPMGVAVMGAGLYFAAPLIAPHVKRAVKALK